jgi:hypothetical protein
MEMMSTAKFGEYTLKIRALLAASGALGSKTGSYHVKFSFPGGLS